MAIRVYLWTDELPGHASMGWRDSQPGAKNKLYFSWWPRNVQNPFEQTFKYVERRNPRNYLSDKLKESGTMGTAKSANVKFTFFHLDDEAVLEFWKALITAKDDTGKYSFLRHNCSTTVAHALAAGNPGVPPPDHKIWHPRRLLEYCTAIAAKNLSTVDTAVGKPKTRDLRDESQVKDTDKAKLKFEGGHFRPAYNATVHFEDIWKQQNDGEVF